MTTTTRKNTNVATLTEAVMMMDCLSQEATDAIMGLVSAAQAGPDVTDPTHLANAMDTLHNLARDSAIEIQAQATQVGCQDTPEDTFRQARPLNASPRALELREAANAIDIYYQEVARKMMSLAVVTKAALDAGQIERILPHLPDLLMTAHHLARDVQNLVNSTAENVGANYIERLAAA